MTTVPDSDVEGTGGEAKAKGSDNTSNQKGSSEPQYVTVADFLKLQKELETLRRAEQSNKDKAVKGVAERVEGLEAGMKELLQHAQRSNKSVGDLLEDLELQEQEQDRRALRELTTAFREGKFPSESRGSDDTKGVDASGVIAELELDETDTRVQAFRGQKFSSREELYQKAAKLALDIAKNRPTSADEPASPASRAALPKSEKERLLNDYNTRAAKVYGPALVRLKKEFRDKGLDI